MSSTPPAPRAVDWLAILAGFNKRYVHIAFHYPPTMDALAAEHRIQPIINTADDWLKYAGNCWIVWSPHTAKQWYEKFAAVKELGACYVLIVNLDLAPENRAGQLPDWAWSWIQKKRQ